MPQRDDKSQTTLFMQLYASDATNIMITSKDHYTYDTTSRQ